MDVLALWPSSLSGLEATFSDVLQRYLIGMANKDNDLKLPRDLQE